MRLVADFLKTGNFDTEKVETVSLEPATFETETLAAAVEFVNVETVENQRIVLWYVD